MKHVIAIHGKRRSGKDTTGDVVAEQGYTKLRFAQQLYDELLAFGFTQIERDKEILRPILLAIGDARRHFDANHYVNLTIQKFVDDRIVVTDLRFRIEAIQLRQWAEKTGNLVTLVKVCRPDFDRNTAVDSHVSECDLDHWRDWDVIQNAFTGEAQKLVDLGTALARIPDNETPWAV
jgi:hypothetical protein